MFNLNILTHMESDSAKMKFTFQSLADCHQSGVTLVLGISLSLRLCCVCVFFSSCRIYDCKYVFIRHIYKISVHDRYIHSYTVSCHPTNINIFLLIIYYFKAVSKIIEWVGVSSVICLLKWIKICEAPGSVLNFLI